MPARRRTMQRDRVPEGRPRTALSRFQQARPLAARVSGQRVQRQPVGGRKGGPLHARSGMQSLQLGARAAAGRAVAVLGAPVVPLERFRVQGRRYRRHRRQLAHQPRRSRAVLFARGGDLPRHRTQGRLAAVPRRQLRGDAALPDRYGQTLKEVHRRLQPARHSAFRRCARRWA